MIQEFSVRNTYSIKEKQTVSLVSDSAENAVHAVEIDGKKILKMASVYGANASGKSNLLLALQFYLNFAVNSFMGLAPNSKTGFVPFEFDEKYVNLPGDFEIIFYIKDDEAQKYVRYEYRLSLTKEGVHAESLHYAPKGQTKLIFKRYDYGETDWGSDVTGQKKIITDMTRENCSMLSVGAQVHHTIFEKVYKYFSDRLDGKGIIFPAFAELSEKILAKIQRDIAFRKRISAFLEMADFGSIKDIDVHVEKAPKEFIETLPTHIRRDIEINGKTFGTRKSSVMHSYNGAEYPLPLMLESAGTIRMMEMGNMIDTVSKKNVLLLVDEIEASLHQELLEAFLNLYLRVSKESQLFFTTHNQELLESGILLDEEIFFCHKTESGNSMYKSVAQTRGKRKEQSRKKLYNDGMFGALPQVDLEKLAELFG